MPDSKFKVRTFVLGDESTNCYIIYDKEKNAIVIDAGNGPQRLIGFIKAEELKVGYIFLTHGHFDHIGGLKQIRDATGAKVAISAVDAFMLESSETCLGNMSYSYIHNKVAPDILLNAGDKIFFGGSLVEIILLGGHTPGDIVYKIENILFTGDVLFRGSMGRTDFVGGDYGKMKASLRRLAEFEGDYIVYPGHGPKTTLEYERKTNPYMPGVGYDDIY
jgi:glyoxylase-like metal-dependent hydrolase (beta-lactamase superfamily II)